MEDHRVIAIDLAKNVFQVCVLGRGDQVLLNRALRRKQLGLYLSKQRPSLVAMEACAGAHYWGRLARGYGHRVVLLPPKRVSPYRQGQKTDGNDALAIAIAARQPRLKAVGLKTVEQQGIQSEKRVEEHLTDQLTATGNLLRSLVAEFGVVIPKGISGLKRRMPLILEDADNGIPILMRESLYLVWRHWQQLARAVGVSDRILANRVTQLEPCQRLQALHGVATKNAIGLYAALGQGDHFKNGREAAACIGVTPRQHSTGGKVVLMGIGKFRGHQRLRSSLILGARAVVNPLAKRAPRTATERWLKELIDRRGPGRAAVALANKNIRTAWAMLHYNTSYRPN
ncbi:MAG: IS110 family transposase [Saprospiraceae bacterium]|nr:IS110 family transposase [Saprospiraceae bacterium]